VYGISTPSAVVHRCSPGVRSGFGAAFAATAYSMTVASLSDDEDPPQALSRQAVRINRLTKILDFMV